MTDLKTKEDPINAQQLRSTLHFSTTKFYRYLGYGMPYHQLGNSRRYYYLTEVRSWLNKSGYHAVTTWAK